MKAWLRRMQAYSLFMRWHQRRAQEAMAFQAELRQHTADRNLGLDCAAFLPQPRFRRNAHRAPQTPRPSSEE
jgi:hypothetical protein